MLKGKSGPKTEEFGVNYLTHRGTNDRNLVSIWVPIFSSHSRGLFSEIHISARKFKDLFFLCLLKFIIVYFW